VSADGSGMRPEAGTEPDATDVMPENTLPAQPGDHRHEIVGVREGMFGVQGSGDTSGYGGLVRPVAMPAASEPPYGGWFDEVARALADGLAELGLPDAVEKVVVHRGEITFFIRRERLLETAKLLRDSELLRFEMCLGVSGVHYPGDQGRELHAVYHLLSMTHNRRIRLEVVCPEQDPHVPSVVSVYPTNDWHERETYDFFGIIFDGHPALTRIEMPDDWPGHPQRKDYPLGGVPVEYKGATIPPPDTRRAYS
jgi:NADH-quinone oxidoreductase subunit C